MDNIGFDVTELLKGIQTGNGQQEQIVYLPYAALVPDQNNGYSMDGLDELARNIEIVGLLQPLRVRPIKDTTDAWKIVAGHRRHAAIGLLIKGGSDKFSKGVPCIIDRTDIHPALQELQLLFANADNRKSTPADQAQEVARVSDCLMRLENAGYHFDGRHRDWVSKLTGMSRTKIARLSAIGKNLITPLINPWNEGKLPETTAYALQQLPEAYQLEAFYRMNKRHGFEPVPADRVETCVERLKAYEQEEVELACPDGAACTQAVTRRVSATLTAEYAWARCEGGCCLKCSCLNRCHFPCATAAAKMKEKKAAEKADDEKRKEDNRIKAERTQTMRRRKIQKDAARLIPLIESVKMPNDYRLPLESYGTISVEDLRRYATGDFDNVNLYDDNLMPNSCYEAAKMAKKLHCSADFLLGLTEDPTPADERRADPAAPPEPGSILDTVIEFQDGDPPEEGRYWCTFQAGGYRKSLLARWKEEAWWFDQMDATIDSRCLGWWPLPEG